MIYAAFPFCERYLKGTVVILGFPNNYRSILCLKKYCLSERRDVKTTLTDAFPNTKTMCFIVGEL